STPIADDEQEDPQSAFEARVEQAISDGVSALDLLALTDEGLHHFPASGALLVAFEGAVIDAQRADLAKETFDWLVSRAMGPHGARGLRYRQAACLETLGDLDGALEAYREAFELAP